MGRSTVSQSALLSEITEAVGEVGEKARKADEALTNQKNLIDDLSSALDDAERQLSGMSDKAASMSLGCSRMDYCKASSPYSAALSCPMLILAIQHLRLRHHPH